jgi:translation initiation factor 2 subunit 1
VSPEDIVKCEERYMKSKTVSSILRHVATKLPTVSDGSAPEAPVAAEPEPEPEPEAAPQTPATAASDAALGNEPAAVVAAIEPEGKEGKRARRAAARAVADEAAAAVDGAAAAEEAAGEERRVEELYESIGWPLHKKYGHPYEAFKLALTYVPPPHTSAHALTLTTWIANPTLCGAACPHLYRRRRSRCCNPHSRVG